MVAGPKCIVDPHCNYNIGDNITFHVISDWNYFGIMATNECENAN